MEWTAGNDGAPCNDGLWCTGADFCQTGFCTAHDDPPCGPFQDCDESQRACFGDDLDDDRTTAEACQDTVELIYETCDFKVRRYGNPVIYEVAYSFCINDEGPWFCAAYCAAHDNVEGCGDFGKCLTDHCSLPLAGLSSNKDDDDDDDGGCGCG